MIFRVTCRGVFSQGVIGQLDAQGVYWFTGGSPDTPPSLRANVTAIT